MDKKIIVFFLLATSLLCADSETASKLDLFLKDSQEGRIVVVKDMSARLSLDERQALFQKYRKDAVGPFI